MVDTFIGNLSGGHVTYSAANDPILAPGPIPTPAPFDNINGPRPECIIPTLQIYETGYEIGDRPTFCGQVNLICLSAPFVDSQMYQDYLNFVQLLCYRNSKPSVLFPVAEN